MSVSSNLAAASEAAVGCLGVGAGEKVLGTAHLAFGTSASFGDVNQAGVHIDGILLAPTIELDGQPLLTGGPLGRY